MKTIYQKTYKLDISSTNIKQIVTFLEYNHFIPVSDIFAGKNMQLVNTKYKEMDLLFPKDLLVNFSYDYDSMTLSCNLVGSWYSKFLVRKYIKLIFRTCYTIVKKDDYQENKWKKMKQMYLRQSEKGNAAENAAGEIIGGLLEIIFEILSG